MAKKRRKRKRKVNKKNVLIVILLVSLVIFGISSCLKDLQRVREQEETPVESALIRNTYDWSKLVKDGDRMSYEDDQYTELKREFPSIGTLLIKSGSTGKK